MQGRNLAKSLTIRVPRSVGVETVHTRSPDTHVSERRRGEGEKKERSRKARHASCRLKSGVVKEKVMK